MLDQLTAVSMDKRVVSRTVALLFENACILNLKQNTNDERYFYYLLVLL